MNNSSVEKLIEWIKENKNKILKILLALIILIFLIESAISLFYRESYIDEVFASFRSRLVITGELKPFVNGVFYYPPLVIATHGVVQYFLGPSIYSGRILSICFLALILIISYKIASRLAGKWAG